MPAARRLEALKFLVHFVGDVHQPLHCSNNHDHGGNDIAVEYNGNATNLHVLWDTGILRPAVDKAGTERAYALRLYRSITAAELSRWRHGNAAAASISI